MAAEICMYLCVLHVHRENNAVPTVIGLTQVLLVTCFPGNNPEIMNGFDTFCTPLLVVDDERCLEHLYFRKTTAVGRDILCWLIPRCLRALSRCDRPAMREVQTQLYFYRFPPPCHSVVVDTKLPS